MVYRPQRRIPGAITGVVTTRAADGQTNNIVIILDGVITGLLTYSPISNNLSSEATAELATDLA